MNLFRRVRRRNEATERSRTSSAVSAVTSVRRPRRFSVVGRGATVGGAGGGGATSVCSLRVSMLTRRAVSRKEGVSSPALAWGMRKNVELKQRADNIFVWNWVNIR